MRLAVSVFLSLCLLGTPAFATSTTDLSLTELARQSSRIVHGTVERTGSRWNEDHTLIVTEIRVRVQETLRGRPQPEVVVIQPGGRVGKLRVDVDGAAAFREGEEAILFLGPESSGRFRLVGMNQGKYRIESDPGSERKRIIAPHGRAAGPMTVDGFLENLRGIVRALPKQPEH